MAHVEIWTYPVQTAPLLTPSAQSPFTPNQYNLLRNEEAPLLIEPSVQSPITPNQYNLLRNEEALPC